jgi:hypothetical protein
MSYRDVKQRTAEVARQAAISEKVASVRAALNLEPLQRCRWPGCGRSVRRVNWCCPRCWNDLPVNLRGELFRFYNPDGGAKSDAAVAAALAWIAANSRRNNQR